MNQGNSFVFLATLLTCSLVSAAEVFHSVSAVVVAAAAARGSSAEELLSSTNRDQKKVENGQIQRNDLSPGKRFVSNCGPAGKKTKKKLGNVMENQLLCLKHAEVLLSKAASSPGGARDEEACGVSGRPPGVNARKHMNINEDADEKRGKRAH